MKEPRTITTVRKAALEQELRYLRTTRSRELEAMLAEAEQFEDAEDYDATVRERERLHCRVEEIASILAHAVVVESPRLSDAFIAALEQYRSWYHGIYQEPSLWKSVNFQH